MAWINEVEAAALGVHGEGNVAKYYGVSVTFGQSLVIAYCG